jgi:DNA-binding transcriptional regulator LsrR (DeoR family)
MAEKKHEAVRLSLQGKRATEIATELGISRARVYQLLAEARKDATYSVAVQVKDARGVEREDIAIYLKAMLARAGIGTHKNEEA